MPVLSEKTMSDGGACLLFLPGGSVLNLLGQSVGGVFLGEL